MRRRRRSHNADTGGDCNADAPHGKETARDRREDAEVEANLDSHIDEILAEEDDVAPSPNAPNQGIPPTLTIWAMNAARASGTAITSRSSSRTIIHRPGEARRMRAVVHITDRACVSSAAPLAWRTIRGPWEKTQSLPHLKTWSSTAWRAASWIRNS